MSQTLWGIRTQAKQNADAGINPKISWATVAALTEQVARETVIHVEDRMRVAQRHRMLWVTLCFSVAAYGVGILIAWKFMTCAL